MAPDTAAWAIAGLGIGLMVAIALTIGYLDSASRASAWRRIAEGRRQLWAMRRQVDTCRTGPRCADCPLDRLRGR